MDTSDKISINLLLSDILAFVDDETTRQHGFNNGYYISGIQKAVEKLAYDTFFDIQTKDIMLLEEHKKNLAVEMPANAFNIREMYLFNCGCDTEEVDPDVPKVCGCCTPASSVIVHWKRQYNNKGRGQNYTAKRVDRGRDRSDPIYGSNHHHHGSHRNITTDGGITDSLYYANIQNGLIMLSLNSVGFSHLRLVYNGTAGAIGDEPEIPRFLRDAIIDYVVEMVYRRLKGKDPRKYRTLWADAFARLNDDKDGSWVQAERRIKKLDTWKRDGMREWTGRMNS